MVYLYVFSLSFFFLSSVHCGVLYVHIRTCKGTCLNTIVCVSLKGLENVCCFECGSHFSNADIRFEDIDDNLWRMGMAYNHGRDKKGNYIGKTSLSLSLSLFFFFFPSPLKLCMSIYKE